MSSFAGLFTTLTFGKNKSLLAVYQALKGYVYLWGRVGSEKQEVIPFSFWGPDLFVAWGLWRTGFPSTYPIIPKQNSLNIFFYFPLKFYSSFEHFSCLHWTPSFQWCVKCDGKLNCLSLMFTHDSPRMEWTSLLYFPLSPVCWLLLCSVWCLEQIWLMIFFHRNINFTFLLWINSMAALCSGKNLGEVLGNMLLVWALLLACFMTLVKKPNIFLQSQFLICKIG